MARYFGGFRDRLKKRSKHVPVTIQDVEWVRVATTFSWSPARRDYLWQEPEDYLSSFLNSNEKPFDEVQGDGSADVSMEIPFAGQAYDGSESLIQGPEGADMDEEDTIAYIPPYDFSADNTPSYNEENALRPDIDVPAELPLLDEYKLEIVSALQRRGIKIDVSKVKLPQDLSDQLKGYHDGHVSIDTYELRARLQKYKRQVIESYEKFNAVSNPVASSLSQPTSEENDNILIGGDEKEEDEDYESYILTSLNRLEESMRDDEPEVAGDMIGGAAENEAPAPSEDLTKEEDSDIDTRGGIRTTRDIETPPDTSDVLAEGLTASELKEFSAQDELPSSYADDSWLVLPVDSRKAGQDLENPDNLDEKQASGSVDNPLLGESDEAQDNGGDTTESSELLKALNTINSRFPESTVDEDELDLRTENLHNAFEDLSEDLEFLYSKDDLKAQAMPEEADIANDVPEDTSLGVRGLEDRDDSSGVSEDLPDAKAHEDPFSSVSPNEPVDKDSLSDFLLKLRHESDRTILDVTAEDGTEDDIDGHRSAANNATIEEIPSDAEEEQQINQTVNETPLIAEVIEKDEASLASSIDEERINYIAEQRKKLYSLIGELEENVPDDEINSDVDVKDAEDVEAEDANITDNPTGVEAKVETDSPDLNAELLNDKDILVSDSDTVNDIQNALQRLKFGSLEQPIQPNESGLERTETKVDSDGPASTLLDESEDQNVEVQTSMEEHASPDIQAGVDFKATEEIEVTESLHERSAEKDDVVKEATHVIEPEEIEPGEPHSEEPVVENSQTEENIEVKSIQKLAEQNLIIAAVEQLDVKSADSGDEEVKATQITKVESEALNKVREVSSENEATRHLVSPEAFAETESRPVKNDEVVKEAELQIDKEKKPAKPSFGSINAKLKQPLEVDKKAELKQVVQKVREESLQNERTTSMNPLDPVFLHGKATSKDVKQKIIEPSEASSVTHDAQVKHSDQMTQNNGKQSEQSRRVSKGKTAMAEPQTTENEASPATESSDSGAAEVVDLSEAPAQKDFDTTSDASESTLSESKVESDAIQADLDKKKDGNVSVSVVDLTKEETEKVIERKPDEGLIETDEPVLQEVPLSCVVESLAFATEDPIPLKKIARIYSEIQGIKMPTEKKVRDTVMKLNEQYEENGRSYRIKEWAGGIRMASHPQYARFIRALYKDHRPKKLSRTLMESLAIIAYSQPSTKPEIDFVRGVDSDYAVRKLLELGLIDIVGRSDSIGRPLLYGTSERFLEQFGLSEIEALPKLREVEDLLGDPAFKKERLQLLALEEMETASSNGEEESAEKVDAHENGASESAKEGFSTDVSDEPGASPAE